MPVTWTRRGASAETYKPLNQRLRGLNQQFKRFQQMTFTHLQSIAENYNISNNIDSRFQVLSRQFERISRELRAFKETTEHSLKSLKSWTKSLQKKTKRLDLSLANMTRALRENNNLNLRQIQKQRTVLSDLSHKIQKQQSHIGSLRNQVQHGMQDLQASLRRHQTQIMKLESQMQGLFKIISTSKKEGLDPLNSIRRQQGVVLRHVQPKPKSEGSRMKDRLPSGPTEQPQTYKIKDRQQRLWQSTMQPTVQAEEELFQLPLQHKIPHIQTPKEEARSRFWYYLDRHLISTGSKFQKGYEIPPGGSMVLGQEQDSIGGDFDEAEAFVGRLAGFALWTRSLSPGEVSGLASGKGVPRGAVLSLVDVDQMFGSVQHVTCECLEHCM
ncbi:Pentraxin-4 [Labeo rohita]|uniref:Pentraxin-4 n=1 Tax=Labeo rohita TaxID=84645 RepID=A0ABQ8MU27_LABRO|nr:Pentraxin-4 [Labeo rohita]